MSSGVWVQVPSLAPPECQGGAKRKFSLLLGFRFITGSSAAVNSAADLLTQGNRGSAETMLLDSRSFHMLYRPGLR